MAASGFWYGVLTSGTYATHEITTRSRIIFLNTVIIVGVVTLLSFSAIAYNSSNYPLSISTASVSIVLIFGFLYIRLTRQFIVGDYIASQSIFLLYCYLFLSGGEQGSGVLWVFSYPLIALFLHHIRIGSIMSAILFAIIATGILHPDIGTAEYSVQYGIRIIGSYVFIFVFGLIYEIVRESTQRSLEKANQDLLDTTRALTEEKTQTDAIFKNVQEGIFLMNQDFELTSAYSRHLEELLESESLAGRTLPELINPYLTEKNRDALQDYLPMLLDSSMNPELIRDINPLEEIRISIPNVSHSEKSTENQVHEKTLQFLFEPVQLHDEDVSILSVVHDVTAQTELAVRMAAEQQKHQRDMETLFQVLHVDPRLMSEFIEDTEQELFTINELLRDKTIDIPDTLATIFQSVHSIKGNALLLGLEELAITLHKLEQHVKDLTDMPDCTWRDLLHLTVSLGTIQQAIEDTNAIIQKLVTFQHASTEAGLSQAGLLERAIQRIAERESTAAGIPIDLQFRDLDLLPDHARKPVRDILVQMIRNSFAHGFESPEERQATHKPAEAHISILLQEKNGVELVYQDDGAGIDCATVRRQAARLPGTTAEEAAAMSDQQAIRLLFTPSFSTAEECDTSAGRGVGMSLIHSKVKSIGGRISINNSPGLGLRLTVHIPAEKPVS